MFNDILNYILGLGAAIFLPIIMIILGLCVKMKLKKAIMAGLTLGIAFTGMNVVLGFMFSSISPAAQALVERTGLELTAIDVGWSPIAAIAWAWPFALFMFPLQIGINLVMLALKLTNCLNVDLWNVWGKILTATLVAYITGNIAFGFIAGAIQIILELISGDLIQKRCYEATKIPGVTCTHPMFLQGPILFLINRILDFIPGINKVNIDANELKKRIGIIVLVPIELILAVVLSQLGLNTLIPLASIINVVLTPPAMIIARKNLVRMFLISIIATPSYLIAATQFAPQITKMAADTNTLHAEAGQFISWMQVEAPEFRWSIVHAFNGDLTGIIGIIIFAILFAWYFLSMKKSNTQDSAK